MPRTLLEGTVDELAAKSAAKPFDCVIAGAGSSGLTAARTLAEQGLKVAVREAGPAPFLTHIANTELRFSRQLSDNVRNQGQYAPRYSLMIRSFASTEKRDSNRVEAKEGDLGSAIIHFEYSDDDEARKAAIQESSARIGTALGLTLHDERISGPGSSSHEAGGLDRGADPSTSVPNPQGCFHRVPNLVCVEAAIFPRIGGVNPHLTIVAVSRRQASLLAKRLA